MAWQDRDYYRSSGSGFSRLAMWSVTTWIIAINVAVFVLDQVLLRMGIGQDVVSGDVLVGRAPLLAYWGNFSFAQAIGHLQLWRFVSFQFLHANVGHIFFNMLALYFFGPMIEQYLGSRRYLVFYLLCGMGGAAGYLVLWTMGILITSPYVPLVGASAGIFGVLIAAARIAPDTQVMLMFPPIPMRLRTLAWVFLGIAGFVVLSGGPNAGGEAAHLGGAGVGALLIQYPQALNVFDFSIARYRRRKRMRSDDWWRTDIRR
jgi:membrane associated rhomboid family serine protease